MADSDYTHRTTAQKLGVKPDQRVEAAGDVGPGLRIELKEALGRGLVRSGPLDGALVLVAYGAPEVVQDELAVFASTMYTASIPSQVDIAIAALEAKGAFTLTAAMAICRRHQYTAPRRYALAI